MKFFPRRIYWDCYDEYNFRSCIYYSEGLNKNFVFAVEISKITFLIFALVKPCVSVFCKTF